MFDQDSLEQWLISTSVGRKQDPREQKSLYDELGKLEQWLALPAETRPKTIPQVRSGLFGSARLAEKDLLPTQQIYRQLLVAKGNGKSYIEPSLIALMAFTLNPAIIPFFVELLSIPSKSGDVFANRRRKLALSGLAFLVYQADDPDAMAALLEATRHSLPFVRAEAIHYLNQIFVGVSGSWISASMIITMPKQDEAPSQQLRREPTAAVLARLAEIVSSDPAFQPRFMARRMLAELDQPAALDHPDGAYAFRVAFKRSKTVSRTIELRSEQSLEDLHLAIQQALRWDNDHLYSFYLNSTLDDDQRYRFASPMEEDEPQWTTDGVIGALGLMLKHTFLYYFDYGDSHEFEVQVVGIRPQAEPSEYPRLIASTGKAPPQYYYDDEDEDY